MANGDGREPQLALLAALMARFRAESRRLAEALYDDVITLAAWLAGMRALIKRLHTSAALLAGDFVGEAVGARIQEQYEYLDGFAAAIQDGDEDEFSVAAIIARAALYAGAAAVTFWLVVQGQEIEVGRTEARLITMGDDRVCDLCLEVEARGWMPIADMPMDLHSGCRCRREYR